MKLFKKLLSYIIAVTMVLSLATLLGGKVYAADTTPHVITIINAPSGRTYKAYQIFKGDYSDGTLSNIEWGDNVTPSTLLSKLKGDTTYFSGINDESSVRDVAEKMSSGEDTAQAKAFAKYAEASKTGEGFASTENTETKKTTITVTGSGYYLVEDTTDASKQSSKNESYTRYIVKVVGGNTDINLKGNVPTVEKKVKDTNDSTGVTSDWQDSADADINDKVDYQITGTMPSNIDDYDSYKYVFTDTMSKGLTYNANTTTIKIGNTDVKSSFKEVVTNNTDGSTTVTWTCNNLKGIDGVTLSAATTVVVNYKATLNENAVIGAAGNPNTVDLTYSNNPNKGGDGETGKTPKDKNIVFTYKTVFNKVDQDGGALAGADFKLEKFINGQWSVLADSKSNVKFNDEAIKSNEGKTFTFKGLDDGIYRLVETTTPDGYNTMKPLEFKITADHTNDPATLELTSLTMEKMTALNDSNDQTLSNNVAGTESNGIMTTDVVNKSGSTLPSTGGMGTTLLYVAGGILVACAAAYVVLNKKRA